MVEVGIVDVVLVILFFVEILDIVVVSVDDGVVGYVGGFEVLVKGVDVSVFVLV